MSREWGGGGERDLLIDGFGTQNGRFLMIKEVSGPVGSGYLTRSRIRVIKHPGPGFEEANK